MLNNKRLKNEMIRTKEKDSAQLEYTVLCVDDDPSILSSMERLLRNEPYKLITTASFSDALSYVEKFYVNLAILDQRMPSMTGIEIAKEMKLRSRDTAVLILTGYPSEVPVVKSIMLDEIDMMLFKPWNDKQLKETILGFLPQQKPMK